MGSFWSLVFGLRSEFRYHQTYRPAKKSSKPPPSRNSQFEIPRFAIPRSLVPFVPSFAIFTRKGKLHRMQATASPASRERRAFSVSLFRDRIAIIDLAAAALSAILLTLSFPNFDFWPLAWIGLVPLLLVLCRRPAPINSLLLGWFAGTIFFYSSCYWLTFSMIEYGGLPAVVAYLLLLPAALVVGIFPGLFALTLSLTIKQWKTKALLLAPFFWIAFEWLRLSITGQLWNAIGYSQAFQPILIHAAHWGGVYAVGFLLVAVNAAVAFAIANRTGRSIAVAAAVLFGTGVLIIASERSKPSAVAAFGDDSIQILALQPNVPMHLVKTTREMKDLTERHIVMTEQTIKAQPFGELPQLVVWPESPMYFSYATDSEFRRLATELTTKHKVSLIFNSQEPAPNNGVYNSAMMINEDGRLIGQYDKIRLLPFGEYVPLPRWMPGASLITAIVGDFTPGANYTLFPVGQMQTGVFICIESAYPSIARAFTDAGAEVLINISNDGYLGRTAVMRQHLANAIFRAVENGRPVVRVTNTGITALIDSNGYVNDATPGFEQAVRVWTLARPSSEKTFYTRHGDLFVMLSTGFTAILLAAALVSGRRKKLRD